jgi:hypothetical protein
MIDKQSHEAYRNKGYIYVIFPEVAVTEMKLTNGIKTAHAIGPLMMPVEYGS